MMVVVGRIRDGLNICIVSKAGRQSAWPKIDVERYICKGDGFQEIQHMLCSVERGGANRKEHIGKVEQIYLQ